MNRTVKFVAFALIAGLFTLPVKPAAAGLFDNLGGLGTVAPVPPAVVIEELDKLKAALDAQGTDPFAKLAEGARTQGPVAETEQPQHPVVVPTPADTHDDQQPAPVVTWFTGAPIAQDAGPAVVPATENHDAPAGPVWTAAPAEDAAQ